MGLEWKIFACAVTLAVALLFCPHPTAAEGAGSALANVGLCASLLGDILSAPVGTLKGKPVLVAKFNNTLFAGNSTRFTRYMIADQVDVLTELDAAANTAVVEDLSIPEPSQVVVPESLPDGFNASDIDVEGLLSVNLTTFNTQSGNTITEIVATVSEDFSVDWSNKTIAELQRESDDPDTVERVGALATSLQGRLLPESCQGYSLEDTDSTADVRNDTVVTTSIDEFGTEITTTCVTQVESLANQNLRVHAIGDETEAYLKGDGTMGGYVGETFMYIQSTVPNLTYTYKNLTLQALQEFPLSPWSACVFDISRGLLDLCIGEFFDTPDRRRLTEFSGLIELKAVVLIGPATGGSIDFGRLMRPFTPGLWGGIVLVVVVFAVLLWAFSYKKETNDYSPDFCEWKRFGHSVHLSMQSMLGAALTTDLAEPLQSVYWLGTGYAIFIVVVVAAYTANLAAILTATQSASVFESIEDVSGSGLPVCVQNSLVASTVVNVGGKLNIFETESVDASLVNMDEGKCAAAVIQMDAMHYQTEYQCNSKAIIGEVLFNIPTGVPVKQRYEGLVSRHISDLRVRGVVQSFYLDMIDELGIECKALNPRAGDDEGRSLSFYNSAPLFIVVFVLFSVAIIVHVAEWYHYRTKKIKQLKKAASASAVSNPGAELGMDSQKHLVGDSNSEEKETSQHLAMLVSQVAALSQQVDIMSSKLESMAK